MIKNRAIHAPSVAQIRMWKTFFLRRPVLSIYYYNGLERDIYYPPSILNSWPDIIEDATRLTHTMDTLRTAINHIPMYPETKQNDKTPELK